MAKVEGICMSTNQLMFSNLFSISFWKKEPEGTRPSFSYNTWQGIINISKKTWLFKHYNSSNSNFQFFLNFQIFNDF